MKNEEYMTGWEILASIFLFAMIFGTAWLFDEKLISNL